MKTKSTLAVLIVVVILHLVVSIAHGSVHASAKIDLTPVEFAFVIAVIEIGPLAGLIWMWPNRRNGALLIALTMTGALIFGLVKHFVIPGVDRIDSVHGPEHAMFQGSAILLAITEFLGALFAFQAARLKNWTARS